MSWPAFVITFFFGAYTFVDALLSVELAPDFYLDQVGNSLQAAQNTVRNAMLAISPINSVFFAVTLLFAIGTATRAAVNLGKGDIERAKKTVSSGNVIGLGIVVILIPILLFAAKPWIGIQYSDPVIQDAGFSYVWIVIAISPIFFMNNMLNGLLRNEGRNKIILFAQVLPLFINLFLDWVLMGPGGMGIAGGATATAISYLVTFGILAYASWKVKSEVLNFKILFNFRIKIITFFGIVLVGLSPLLRNLIQAFNQTIILNEAKRVSAAVFDGQEGFINTISSSIFPIFILTVVSMFGVVQGAIPVLAYNYGAKKFARVREAYLFSLLYTTIIGVFSFIIMGFGLGRVLLTALAVSPENIEIGLKGLWVYLSAIPLFAPTISSIILAMSTDRILLSIICNVTYGLIAFIPALFIISAIAKMHPEIEYLYWFVSPFASILSAGITGVISWWILKTIKYKHETIEQKIDKFYKRFSKKQIQT